jgi:hypothetical protein
VAATTLRDVRVAGRIAKGFRFVRLSFEDVSAASLAPRPEVDARTRDLVVGLATNAGLPLFAWFDGRGSGRAASRGAPARGGLEVAPAHTAAADFNSS